MNEVWLRRLRRLEELPGPVWVFGAYVVARAARWAFERSVMLVKGSLDWQTLWVEGLVLLGVLLPVAVLWLLVSGSSRALSLARWYAGLRAVLHFVSLLYPLVVGYGPETVSEVGHEFLARGLVSVAVGAAFGSSFCSIWNGRRGCGPCCLPGSVRRRGGRSRCCSACCLSRADTVSGASPA